MRTNPTILRARGLTFMLALIGSSALGAPAGEGAKGVSGFSDEAIEQSIERAVEFVWSKFQQDHWTDYGGNYPSGPSAMAVYALLESGVSPTDDRMARALNWLKRQDSVKTYSLSLRCQAFLAAMKKGAPCLGELQADASRLIRSHIRGSYSYNSTGKERRGGIVDNSNAQYGLLGVWSAVRGDINVPADYWQVVLKHWLKMQGEDGGWGYRSSSRPTATMTSAGLASLFVCYDNLTAGDARWTDSETADKEVREAIERGLAWMGRHFDEDKGELEGIALVNYYYYAYGVERVGLASGYKFFGRTDWYRTLAKRLIELQQEDGSFRQFTSEDLGVSEHRGLTDTCFATLFLVRGRRPVLFSKLRYNGDWSNRPRDLASLTRWASHTFEKEVNWQIVTFMVPPEQWHDAPILAITGSAEPRMSDEDVDKLRRFVLEGGTILSVTERGGRGFREGIREVYRRLLPDRPLRPIPDDHELYSALFKLDDRERRMLSFEMIDNGIRPLVIHTDADLSRAWQLQRPRAFHWAYAAPANIVLYLTDQSLLPRGARQWPGEEEWATRRTVRVARLKWSGNWDPEPMAYERFSRLMARDHQLKVAVSGPVLIDRDLLSKRFHVATLTGTGRLKLSAGERAALREFVSNGGRLVIDAAGGDDAFRESAEDLLHDMYGRSALRRMTLFDDLFEAKNANIDKVRYRIRTARRFGSGSQLPNLRAISIDGRTAVIFSPEDLTAGLVGYASSTCDGYHPDSAFKIMRNVMLHAAGPAEAETEEPIREPAKINLPF